ncbi:heme exporter protein CcmB [Sporomusa sphaeroides]|uniref:CcmB protein n=2 Tax=Sporomusa TaxID=2375 RepID=A0ABM9W8E0_9FIRM|nr:heme exporter protein CcmB [Sporomusa sphaeroides]OLS55403.1 CcmB protein [Sporomusa sphaeroides DSM 2875]CVK21429.1 CcmB protein [Sporomusa sphaeroides DSM 2875]SCM83497.1 Cytochrome c-type biogenesis protein CcmB [uncultured Sporomusa sp.]
MPPIKLNFSRAVWAIIAKDAVCEFRTRYAVGALVMFALTALSSVSMTLAGAALPPEFAAALLWVVMFFCAMAGLARVFVQEQEAGTLLVLRLYATGMAVYFGKLLFNLVLLAGLTCLVVPLFIMFLNVAVGEWLSFALILVLGIAGIAAVSTLTAAMVMYAQGKHAVFTVLTFPVLLPQFLSVISATAKVLAGSAPELREFVFMAGYDAAVIAAGILLFDYLWQD